MGPLQIALLQAYRITNQKKSPIAGAINKLNKHNQALAKNVNETMERINKSGIKSDVLANSLTNATKSITPITQKATDVRVSILKSMPYQKLPDNFFADLKKTQGKVKGKKVEKDDAGKPKMVIIPVPLEKPIAALAEAAANIQNATFTKPEITGPEQVRGKSGVPDLIQKPTTVKDIDVGIPPGMVSSKEIEKLEYSDGIISEKPEQVAMPDVPRLVKTDSGKGIAPKVKSKKAFKLKDLSFSKKQLVQGTELSREVTIPKTIAATVPLKTIDKDKYIAKKEDLIDFDRPRTISEPISDEELVEHKHPPKKNKVESKKEHMDSTTEPRKGGYAKRTTPGPLIPIMGALGLLAGTTSEATSIVKKGKILKSTSKTSTTSVTDMKMGMMKTEDKIIDVKLPPPRDKVKETSSVGPSFEKPEIGPIDAEEIPSDLDSKIAPVDFDETSETPTTEKQSAIDDAQEQVEGEQIPRLDDELKQPKPETINWAPIAAALGSIGGIAATAVVTNIQAKKQQLTPQPESFKVLTARKTLKTGEESLQAPEMDKTVIKTIRAPERKTIRKVQGKEAKVEELVDIAAKRSSISESGLGYTKPMPAMIPSAGALGLLSFIAKKTVTKDQTLLKPLPIASSGLLDDEKGVLIIKSKRIERRIPMEKANVPAHTGFALKGLNKVAVKTRDKLFIDDIKPIKKPVKDSRTKEQIKFGKAPGKGREVKLQVPERISAKPRRLIDSSAIGASGKRLKDSVQVSEPTRFKRKMLIDGGAIGALGLLNKTAVTTTVARATTIADVFSKPKYRPELPIGISKAPSKLPVTKSIEVRARPDIDAVRGQISYQDFIIPRKPVASLGHRRTMRFDRTRFGVEKDRAGLRMESSFSKPDDKSTPNREALDILNLVAASASRGRESRDGVQIGLAPGRRGIIEVDYSIPIIGEKTPRRGKTAEKPLLVKKTPTQPIHVTSPFRRLPSISEAMKLIQRRPEKVIGERTGASVREDMRTLPGGKETLEPGAGVPSGIEGRPSSSIQQDRKTRARIEILKRRGYLDEHGRPLERPRTSIKQPSKQQELTRPGAPSSKDFDWLPSGAPVRRDATREHIVALEEKVRELSEQLGGKESEMLPANRKLQEVVHDPNLQIQLKKLFYESWLENMEKELKRYGG